MRTDPTIAPSGLAPTGLTEDQLLHFAEHGWVLLERVFDEDTCQAYIDAIDQALAENPEAEVDDPNFRHVSDGFRHPEHFGQVFYDWFRTPGLVAALHQLTGTESIQLLQSSVNTVDPHPDRHTRRDELMNPRTWAWHRDYRPKWIVSPHDTDPRLINSVVVVCATYFTPISAERGVTAIYDGSHKIEGPQDHVIAKLLADPSGLAGPTAPAGSIIIFTESLVHSSRPVVADERRVCSLMWMGGSWMVGDSQRPYQLGSHDDRELRPLFRAPQASDEPWYAPDEANGVADS